jgi:hypothetical protein
MNLQSLRSSLFEITKKSKHNASDAVAIQLIGMQVTGLLISRPELVKTKEAESFVQFLFKETRRVLKTARDNSHSEPEEPVKDSSGMEG